MHIYIFGSLCRGEIDVDSDIDIIVLLETQNVNIDPSVYSIYSYERIKTLWRNGNPFAWHLFVESKLVFSHNGNDFIKELGPPACYSQSRNDCIKFFELYSESLKSLEYGSVNLVFELSNMFLAIRNFSICYALGIGKLIFSRHAALQLGVDSLRVSGSAYRLLENSRILSVRGRGKTPSREMYDSMKNDFRAINDWMMSILWRLL